MNIIFPLILVTTGVFFMTRSKAMTISDTGLSLIKKHEGYSSTVYKDQAGLDTIGYGHLIVAGEKFTEISHIEAEQLLRRDVRHAERTVNNFVNVYLTQNMFDSLVSFVFNVGSTAFINSTLLKVLNAGEYEKVGEQLLRWNKITITENGDRIKKVSSGLANRRQYESEVFYS